jgi:hypothetical protein
MAESLLKRSGAKSIMDKSRVTKDEYVEIPSGIEEKPSILDLAMKPKKEGILRRAERGLIHWAKLKPEEHKYLHAIADDIRHKMGITGDTPPERITSIASHIEHGIGGIGAGLLEEAKRKREEYSHPAMMPSAVVQRTEVEMPSAIERQAFELPEERAEVAIPVGESREILVCRKLKDVV